jgi:small subunit ribosomal protein S20
MPILKNAKKALRVSRRKTIINQRIKSQVKTSMDKMKVEPSSENLQEAYSAIDMANKRNIFHRNKAARYKRQMSVLLATKSETKKPAAKKPAKKTTTTKKTAKASKKSAK